ncbi:MAG TPA: hypothetical protein VM010_02090 [Chitinophagaceae bacterium]|nr:hypothetical protein [Chitinophagaceae bacterium]
MKSMLSARNAFFICCAVLFSFTVTSWKEGTPAVSQTHQDTVPVKQEKKTKDLDEALNELDNAKADLEKNIKEIDWDKMNADLKESLKNLDVNLKDLNADLKKSLQSIDVEKMKLDVDAAVAKIDWEKMKTDLEKSKALNMDSLKAELENMKIKMQDLKPELEKNLQEARKSLEKAKGNMQGYKSFIDGLASDGLLHKNEDYKVEHKDGQLLINGVKQSNDVYNKYKTFLQKNKSFVIQKNEDGFQLNNDVKE